MEVSQALKRAPALLESGGLSPATLAQTLSL